MWTSQLVSCGGSRGSSSQGAAERWRNGRQGSGASANECEDIGIRNRKSMKALEARLQSPTGVAVRYDRDGICSLVGERGMLTAVDYDGDLWEHHPASAADEFDDWEPAMNDPS